MKVIKRWDIGSKRIEILHESGDTRHRARWEYRVNGELRMYGVGTPKNAREAVFTRRKLAY